MRSQVAVVAAALALLAGGGASAAPASAPANTSPPTISGTPRQGDTLTASTGSWSGSTPMTFAYQWQRCDASRGKCKSQSGATGQAYNLRGGDVGHTIRVSVRASNSEGSASAISAPTAVIDDGRPTSSAAPAISGIAKDGQTLTASSGTWSGSGPITYSFRWQRCDSSGHDCSGASSGQVRTLTPQDVGHTMRVLVTARNQYGSRRATSARTALVAPRGPLPVSTAAPVVTGTPRAGQTLGAGAGTWSNSPTRFKYQWMRCDTAGNGCANFGADQPTQLLGATEVGHTIRVRVTAINQYGSTMATSAQTATVAAGTVTAASIPVSQVSLPQRLVISGVRFVPARLTSRSAFLARFRVTDTRGNLVSGALVYALGLPYGWVRAAPEVVTASDGWATIQLFPTISMPLHRAALVLFVRARKPGESVLAGVSTRRLVQVGIG